MDNSRPANLTIAAAWIGLLTSVVACGYAFGVLANRVDNLETQVAEIRADARANASTLAEIKDTTTVIKTKLEILLPTAPEKGERQ